MTEFKRMIDPVVSDQWLKYVKGTSEGVNQHEN